MISHLTPGPPPPWLPGLVERVKELLGRALDAGRAAAAASSAAARRGWTRVRAAAERGRDRARPGVAQARRRIDAGLGRARALLGPGLRRVSRTAVPALRRARAAAGPLLALAWVRTRAAGRRAAAFLRAHRPSRAQAVVLGVLAFAGAWILWERCGLAGCPDVDRLASYQPGGASVLLDRHGEPFADLAPMEYEVVALDSMPDYVADAFVAVEDRRFYEHHGVDWVRSVGALIADIRAMGAAQGASTIPMQLSRTLFPDRIRREEKTLRRKLLEVRMAGEIEERFSKREILELYLNHVYLGGGSYGIQAASRYWFGKDATELELEEAALLAALPRAPSYYDPRRHPERARARRDLVLTLMERQDLLPFREAEAARKEELAVAEEPDRDRDGDLLGPYFVQHVRRLLSDELGERLYAEPLRIHTTLDPRAQRAAEEELEAQLRRVERGWYGRSRAPRYDDGASPGGAGTGYLQGVVVLMDARTGDVRAWVGGRDYDHSRFDRARLARRQAGSAFKPFVYGAALEQGLVPSQPVDDSPYVLARAGSRPWRPENYSGRFDGRMSMREALVRSQNIPAIRVAGSIGNAPVRDLARRAGIDGEIPASPVAALGVTTVSPVEMTSAYAAFATLGVRPAPRFVVRVEDADGDVVWERPPVTARVLDPAVAYVLTDMLRDVVDRGTATGVRSAGYHGPAAGKTGTTSDATDVWFVGYTPELVGTVWVGYDEVRPLPGGATGGGVVAPVWGRIMARAYGDGWSDRWSQGWAIPDGVVRRWIDPETGMTLADGCRPRWDSAVQELFLEDYVPTTVCPRRGWRSSGRFGGWFESVFGSIGPAPKIPGVVDPQLGYPRLPLRGRGGGYDDADAEVDPYRYEDDDEDDRWGNGDRDGARWESERREEERAREARKRYEERVREARKRAEEAAREARKRAEERRRGGGG